MDAFIQRVRKTDLARNMRKILGGIQRGQTVVVEHHGQPEVAIMDILDYHIQRAFIYYYVHSPKITPGAGLHEDDVRDIQDEQQKYDMVLSHYLAENISLSRAAELLDVPWLDLRTRFLRLSIPLRSSPGSLEEARAEIEATSKWDEMD